MDGQANQPTFPVIGPHCLYAQTKTQHPYFSKWANHPSWPHTTVLTVSLYLLLRSTYYAVVLRPNKRHNYLAYLIVLVKWSNARAHSLGLFAVGQEKQIGMNSYQKFGKSVIIFAFFLLNNYCTN